MWFWWFCLGNHDFPIAQYMYSVNVLYVFQKNGHGWVNIVTFVPVQGPYGLTVYRLTVFCETKRNGSLHPKYRGHELFVWHRKVVCHGLWRKIVQNIFLWKVICLFRILCEMGSLHLNWRCQSGETLQPSVSFHIPAHWANNVLLPKDQLTRVTLKTSENVVST